MGSAKNALLERKMEGLNGQFLGRAIDGLQQQLMDGRAAMKSVKWGKD